VNFGGEHFGVGYINNPPAVRYFWLLDDGTGRLVRGPEVQVSTPVFNYAPAVAGAPAQVQAVIQPVVPDERPAREFGDPVWVKEIRTTSHNNGDVRLRDLVTDDPNDPNDRNWTNGEPDEVETEWQLLQTEFAKLDGGANGELAAAAEELPEGDEVVTRRYEFFKYVGPIDNETGEAQADSVGADGIHGSGVKTINGVEVDLSTVVIVGDYIGAQMAAFDAAAAVDLIDHVPDGEIDSEYPARTVIIAGGLPFTATIEGQLPDGMTFDLVSGILSGTPSASGTFSFTVTAQEAGTAAKARTYSLIISDSGVQPPPQSVVNTSVFPVNSGTTTGDGSYDNGSNITVTATPGAGFLFVNWTDNGVVVSNLATYSFTTTVNRSLVAHFVPLVPTYSVLTSSSPADLGSVAGGGVFDEGSSVTVTATANPGAAFVGWTENGAAVSSSLSYTFSLTGNRVLVANFVRQFEITGAAAPVSGGSVSGAGIFNEGSSVTLTAAANAGFRFVDWTEGGASVSQSAAYTFSASSNRSLVANFIAVFEVTASALPAGAGSISGTGMFSNGSSVTLMAQANPGFAFVNWTDGEAEVSTAATYTFVVNTGRALVANFAPVVISIPNGLYKGIVANLISPTPEGTGMITVVVSGGNGAYTANVLLGSTKYAFIGTLDESTKAAARPRRKRATSVTLDMHFDPAKGIVGSVTGAGLNSTFTARHCPYTVDNPLAEWPGTYTHMIGFPRLNLPPLPVGTGSQTISETGAVRVIGKLSDGSSYTCSTNVTDAGTYPLYSPTKEAGFDGFLVGDVALKAEDLGSIMKGSPITWQPATAQPFARFRIHTDRYTPPGHRRTALEVDPGVPNLNVFTANAFNGWHAAWTMMLRENNVATDLGTGPGPISLRIDPDTGVISGRVHAGSSSLPFTGAVWQSTNTAFGIIPGFGDKATLNISAIHTVP
jgi:uncharacterized membrane protein YeaQ/YmgE (transglycosylase-associated protein family)